MRDEALVVRARAEYNGCIVTDSEIHYSDPVDLELQPLNSDGFILDIGGGGEGMVGRLNGSRVVSIDTRMEELLEAPDGPLKIQMDATDLQFPDATFGGAAAFFSMMYIDSAEDHQRVLGEAFRVLVNGGLLHIWDAEIAGKSGSPKPAYAIQLRCSVNHRIVTAAYGVAWPKETRDAAYYRMAAENAGFRHLETDVVENVFHMVLRK